MDDTRLYRYELHAVVRFNDPKQAPDGQTVFTSRTRVTAACQCHARRTAIHNAQQTGLSIVRFTRVIPLTKEA